MNTGNEEPKPVQTVSRRRGAGVVADASKVAGKTPEGQVTPKESKPADGPATTVVAAGESVTLPKEEPAKPVEPPKEEVKPATTEETLPKEESQPAPFVLEGCFPASEVNLDYLKMLIYGDSGSGKTHFSSGKGKGVLILSLETQGRATVRSANPEATIFPCSNIEQLRVFIGMVMTKGPDSPLKKAGIHTIVVDSMTELQQVLMEGILKEKRNPEIQDKKKDDKKDAAKGPAPEFTRNDWGVLAVKQRSFMRVIRDCDYTVILIALCEPVVEENTGIRRLYPKLQGSFQQALPAFVNIVGYIFKGAKGERLVMVDGPSEYLCKSYGPIQGIVPADLPAWQAAIKAEAPSIAIAGAKLPGSSGRRVAASVNSTAAAKAETEKPENDDEGVDI